MNIQGIVRAFRPEDLDQAAEIWLAANTSAHAFLPAEVWQEHLPDLRESLVQATVFVCEREGRLCGFIGLQGSYDRKPAFVRLSKTLRLSFARCLCRKSACKAVL